MILLLDGQLDQLGVHELKASLTARFTRGVEGRGGQAAMGGQHLQSMSAGTEGALANYLFKGTTINPSNDGSRTPMAILDHLQAAGEGLVLWDELTAAISADRRMQIITSRGIDALCGTTRYYS